jgi:hypothetical protein
VRDERMSTLRQKRSAETLLETPRSETTKPNRESGLIVDLVEQGAWRAKLRGEKSNI